eukprot:9558483-Karenia_brevis.AAC.1
MAARDTLGKGGAKATARCGSLQRMAGGIQRQKWWYQNGGTPPEPTAGTQGLTSKAEALSTTGHELGTAH